MKKLVVSLLAITLMVTLSMGAMEKPATPDVDAETLRIEESLGEHPQERLVLQKRLNTLDKEVLNKRLEDLKVKAKQATGNALEKIKAKIQEYQEAIRTKFNK